MTRKSTGPYSPAHAERDLRVAMVLEVMGKAGIARDQLTFPDLEAMEVCIPALLFIQLCSKATPEPEQVSEQPTTEIAA